MLRAVGVRFPHLAAALLLATSYAAVADETGGPGEASGVTDAKARPEGGPASATDFKPKLDVNGLWVADGDAGHPGVFSQHGRQVTVIYDNGAYRHLQSGRFVDDHTLVTIQTRISLMDHSQTRMSLTYIFDSPDHARIYWVVLDSHSDLAAGQTGATDLVRSPR